MYFPIRVSFRVSEGKNGGNKNCFSVLPMSVWLLCALFSFSAIFLCCVFLLCFSPVSPYCFSLCVSLLFFSLRYVLALSFVVDAVFFADLPILLPSVGFSPLLCAIIRLGVFRGSEAEKIGFCVVLVWCIYEKRADETFVCPIRPMSLAGYACCVISCAGMMLCCCVGLLS